MTNLLASILFWIPVMFSANGQYAGMAPSHFENKTQCMDAVYHRNTNWNRDKQRGDKGSTYYFVCKGATDRGTLVDQ